MTPPRWSDGRRSPARRPIALVPRRYSSWRARTAGPSSRPRGTELQRADAARAEIERVVDAFLYLIEDPEVWREYIAFLIEEYGLGFDYTLTHAMRIDTGAGKTQIVIKRIAASKLRYLYTVPIHELAGRVEQQFIDLGVSVAIFRGRDRDDPNNPGKKMCLNLEAVEAALKARTDVTKACCKYGKFECQFYRQCGYQAQKKQKPQVWIAASNVLFHQQKVFKIKVVINDESFWQNGVVGVKNDEQIITVPLAALASGSYRERLLGSLMDMQDEDGGLQRRWIDDEINDEIMFRLTNEKWAEIMRLQKEIGFYPGCDVRRLNKRKLGELALAYDKKQIYEEIRTLVRRTKVEASGRLLLDWQRGQRVIKWRGVREINWQFRSKPTLSLDATLPGRKIPEGSISAGRRSRRYPRWAAR